VRIPTLRAHSEAITIETALPITPDDVRATLKDAPGVDIVDDPLANKYPMPLTASNKYNVEVGRIRSSLVFEPKGIDMFVSGDQLLRGAALNAILIAEKMIEQSRSA
jgi:aspartate-semialdehyde dehydrogenase